MGRTAVSHAPPPVEYLGQCFVVDDNSGRLLWASRPPEHFGQRREDAANWNARFPGKDAGWMTPSGLMVRFTFEGRTRRMSALRVAWVLATGEYPGGAIEARDGDRANLRPENLIERPRDWTRVGGPSLKQREASAAALVAALAQHPDASIAQISRLVGSDKPCTCRRLAKLAEAGLTCGPMCVPSRHWHLTGKGADLAAQAAIGRPVLDEVDDDLLRAVASRPHTKLTVAAALALIAEPTARRRLHALEERKLVSNSCGWTISEAGLAAIGGRPEQWVTRLVEAPHGIGGIGQIRRFG